MTAALATTSAPVAIDRDAIRAWLNSSEPADLAAEDGSAPTWADRHLGGEGAAAPFGWSSPSFVSVVTDLVAAVLDAGRPFVHLDPLVRGVDFRPTLNEDGEPSGGGLILVDLVGGGVRLSSLHQGPLDLLPSDATGVDAALECLGHVAAVVSALVVNFRQVSAQTTAFRVDRNTITA